jgi:hypothetical protein
VVETDSIIEVILRTSKHHIQKIQHFIANPVMWAVVNYKEKEQRNFKEDDETIIKKIELESIKKPDFLSCLFNKQRDISYNNPIIFLNFSAYNPPSTPNRLSGDLIYLHMKIL